MAEGGGSCKGGTREGEVGLLGVEVLVPASPAGGEGPSLGVVEGGGGGRGEGEWGRGGTRGWERVEDRIGERREQPGRRGEGEKVPKGALSLLSSEAFLCGGGPGGEEGKEEGGEEVVERMILGRVIEVDRNTEPSPFSLCFGS